jgi:hypothetical protein
MRTCNHTIDQARVGCASEQTAERRFPSQARGENYPLDNALDNCGCAPDSMALRVQLQPRRQLDSPAFGGGSGASYRQSGKRAPQFYLEIRAMRKDPKSVVSALPMGGHATTGGHDEVGALCGGATVMTVRHSWLPTVCRARKRSPSRRLPRSTGQGETF